MQVKIHQMDEKDCANCGIRENSLFADLISDDFRLIDQPIHDVTFDAQATVYEEGAPGQHLYTIRSGLVKLVRYQSDGTQRIIRLLTSGDIAGLEITAHAAYDSTAVAVTEIQSCRIPHAVISRLEDADYEGHSLKTLQRIATALDCVVEVRFVSRAKRGRRASA